MFWRLIQDRLIAALADTPVVFLRGARQTGKTTLVQMLAAGPYPAHYVTLDNVGILSAASSDPSGFIDGLEKPVVIDEAQRIPDLLLAIKEDVDRNRQPGRYILTGSADILTLPRVADALTGRMEVVTLWPLSVSESSGGSSTIIDELFHPETIWSLKPNPVFDIFATLAGGGFPEPLQRTDQQRRQAWFDAYITTILERDIRNLAQIKDIASVPPIWPFLRPCS